jgi:predicted RNA-binding Zn ribbon-like protein
MGPEEPALTLDEDPPVFQFVLTGGALCLDFANTLDYRPTRHPRELLPDYRRLVLWSVQSGTLSEAEALELMSRREPSPGEEAQALARAHEVREAIYSVFVAAARGRQPEAGSVATLNQALHHALGRLELEPVTRPYGWRWRSRPLELGRPLWPVVRSAADLLTSADIARVRECDAANCGWLFLDKSKNRTRRWCAMKVCGNRDKARRYRAARRVSTNAP